MKPSHISDLDWKIIKEKYKDNLDEVVDKLNHHYPIQYLIGNVEFYNIIIDVDERVLIPRFETEFLVEKTIQKIKELNLVNPCILELGIGSGCISIALKKNIQCEVHGVDISQEAVDLALLNAKLNNVDVDFYQKDMLDVLVDGIDVLISNPPYVSFDEDVGLETSFEPVDAIFASNEGMYFYEEIIKKVSNSKLPKLIAFEIGYLQGEKIKKLAFEYLKKYTCLIESDLANKDRYVFLILNE